MSGAAIDLEQAGGASLLAGDEGLPYEILNPEGRAPVLLLCDHASNFIPRAFRSLGLDEAQLARHIAWDIGVADVTRDLARRLDAPAAMSRFSRLIVDPNRQLDDPTLFPQIGDGVIVPGNRDLSPEARGRRIEAFHQPYHAAIEDRLDAMASRGRVPAIVSMHSFTPVMKGFERPWHIGILWNRDPRLPRPVMDRLRARGIEVGDNEPYSGRDGHGYTLHRHADARGLANVLVELRQDLIDTHHGAAEWSALLAEVLAECLADPVAFEVAAAS
ncbi:MAG: N-formylglutamate amidohydrolase [Rhodospirillales bacterium]|nr:N-formylglutamate amidohydrolase [Rhodospirillales bacterium]